MAPIYEPTWRERFEDFRPYIGPAVAGLLIVAVAGWIAWRWWGPKTVRPADRVLQQATANPESKRGSQVEAWEQTFQKAAEGSAQPASLDAMITGMIEQQRELVKEAGRNNAADFARLARMEKVRALLRARIATARSTILELEATEAEKRGRPEVALEKHREALKLQREANAAVDLRNLVRESQLDAGVNEAEAKPLHDLADAAQARAKAAAAAENWTEALSAYREARAFQIQINGRFPSTRFADIDRVESIDSEIASINGASLASSVVAREREGNAAAARGLADLAGEAYAAAAAAQREINERFSQSRFASTSRADEFLVRHDTVLATGPMGRAATLEREAAQLLRSGQNALALDKIAEARALCEKTMGAYPRSRDVDQTLRSKLEYLMLRRTEIDVLQDRVRRDCLNVPGQTGMKLLKTEVPQDLFLAVMNFNPSRHQGPLLPVDSVTWDEAREFCRRLTWVLGMKVRLPTEEEIRGVFSAGYGGVWSSESADGRTHEIGKLAPSSAGFCDIAGNVAEWLQPRLEAGVTVPIAGGSFLDDRDHLKTLAVHLVPKEDRSREIGFRVAVEWTAEN